VAFFRKNKKHKSQPQPTTPAKRKTTKRRIGIPVEVKLLAAEAFEAGLSAKEVSEIIDVASTTVNGWAKLFREGGAKALMNKPTSAKTKKACDELRQRIEQMRRENPDAGVRRIRDELRREEAIEVSAEKVRQVVNEAGLGNPPPESRRRPPQTKRFERELPNMLWQIDIFTFQLKRLYPVYLVGIIDDHSRYIVGHGLFRQQNAQAVMEVLKGAVGQWGAPRELLSDNGRQFAAWRGKTRFQKELQRQGIQHVRSAPHHPMTLGKIERFWKTIWDEFLDEAVFSSFADACQRLDHWIAYYNHQRPHQGIDGMCPADRFYGVADGVEEALKQGWQENSLRLALGQETRPPLFLLGKLGETDVRVTRKGDDIEVRLGDTVHEVIRPGEPMRVDEQGHFSRGSDTDERDQVEGPGRRGALPDSGVGPARGVEHQGVVRDVRRKPADVEQGHREGRPGSQGGTGAQSAWPQAQTGGQSPGGDAGEGQPGLAERPGPLAEEVRGGQDAHRPATQAGAWGAASWGGGVTPGEKKNPPEEKETQEYQETIDNDCDEPWYDSVDDEGGRWE
jgi:transposase InsO family protein